jgi:type IV secretory pathway VirD2 relaxase
MEREAELLNAILALQGEVDVLEHDISRAKRIPEKAKHAPIESSSSDEGGTVGMDEVEVLSTTMSTQRTVRPHHRLPILS